MQLQEEGVIVKDVHCKYYPSNRSTQHWLKLKAEYIDNLGDTLDLIILGGYFGEASRTTANTSSWASHLTSFLVGVLARVDEKNPSRSTALPFCKVGQGYSIEALNGLRNHLKNNLETFDPRFQQRAIGRKWTPSQADRPDLIVKDLSKSVVLEVKASELLASTQYATGGYTLRFPRVVRVRYDKPWNEAMSKEDLDTLIADFGNKQRLFADQATRKRRLDEVYESGSDKGADGGDSADDLEQLLSMAKPKRGKKRLKQAAGDNDGASGAKFRVKSKLVEYFREVEIDEAELRGVASSEMLSGMEFYIVNTDEKAASKSFLETVIATNGGRRV